VKGDRTGNSQPSVTIEELLAAAGIEVTDEGKARAKAKLDAGRAKLTPQVRDRAREQVGLPPAANAA
jgi:hypothetical protein